MQAYPSRALPGSWRMVSTVLIKTYVHDALAERRDIANQSFRDQWHQLILIPILKLNGKIPGPRTSSSLMRSMSAIMISIC